MDNTDTKLQILVYDGILFEINILCSALDNMLNHETMKLIDMKQHVKKIQKQFYTISLNLCH